MPNSSQRRINPRNKLACFARFRRPEMGPGGLDWLCVTKNYSHNGIYFLADDHGFWESMQLLLSFPYNEVSPVKNCEFLVEVIRVNRTRSLFQTRCGVGAKLIFRAPVQRHNALCLPIRDFSACTLQDAVPPQMDLNA
jgi:hypothetical protein